MRALLATATGALFGIGLEDGLPRGIDIGLLLGTLIGDDGFGAWKRCRGSSYDGTGRASFVPFIPLEVKVLVSSKLERPVTNGS